MSLYMDMSGWTNADQISLLQDLLTISWNDPQLNGEPTPPQTSFPGTLNGVTTIQVQQLTYPDVTTGMATAQRLFELVTKDSTTGLNWAWPIVITALSGGNDPYKGTTIKGAASTFVDMGAPTPIIHVVYDTSQGGGLGICGFDNTTPTPRPIASPNAVILYAELSHAYHYATQTYGAPQSYCTGSNAPTAGHLDDPASETDENILRSQLGLCQRDVCNPAVTYGLGYSCGGKATPDGAPLPTMTTSDCCFVGSTPIMMANGSSLPIDQVQPNSHVLGSNGLVNRVVGVHRPVLGRRLLYGLNGGPPFVTCEHPFLTRNGWKSIDPEATRAENCELEVATLQVGDRLVTCKGCLVAAGTSMGSDESGEIELESVGLMEIRGHVGSPSMPLFNLILDGDHTYIANGYVVHNKCFIVTAATNSSESAEIVRLRKLRDRVCAVSELSGQLIERIYSEYFRFSPGIASQLEEDPLTRMSVRRFVVRPLLAWYSLSSAIALNPGDRNAVREAERELLKACPRLLAWKVAPFLEAIRSGESLQQHSPQPLLAYMPRIREAARLRLASWAILDALVRAWTLTNRDTTDVLGEIAEWLASAPLEAVTLPKDPKLIDAELGVIAGFLDFQPRARRTMGLRLAKAWPQAVDSLKRHGFIGADS
jgi:hypothetical protein